MITEKEINHLKWRQASEVVQELKEHLSAVIISRASVGVFPMSFEYGVDVPEPINDKNRYIVRTLLESLRESGFSVVTNKDGFKLF
jgi:hypothetical protein